MPKLIDTVTAYAEYRGVAHSAVRNAMNSGRIAGAVRRDEKGKLLGLDREEADRLWSENTDRLQSERRSRKGVEQIDYFEQRARREAAQAELAEIEVAEKRGELVSRQQIEKELGLILRQLRDGFLRVFDRADIALATMPTASHVRVQIRNDSRGFLNEFSNLLADPDEAESITETSSKKVRVKVAKARAGPKRKRVGRRKPSPELESVG